MTSKPQVWKIGDRFTHTDGKLYQIVGFYSMSCQTRLVDPETDAPCGGVFSMIPEAPRSALHIYDEAKASWGVGWKHLSDKQQKAAVSQAIVFHLLTQKVSPGSDLEAFQLLAVRTLQLV